MKQYKYIISNFNYFFSKVYRKILFKTGVYKLPNSIDLEITKVCNLRCPMCTQSLDNWKGKEEVKDLHLNLDKFKTILRKIPSVKFINFIGTGEPLVNPYFFDILKYTTANHIKVTFTTNATLLNWDKVNGLKDKKIKIVYISIDTTDPKKYEKIRVGAKYEKVIENLKLISDESKIPIHIQSIITKDNFEDLPKIVELAKEVGAIQFTYFHPIFYSQGTEENRVFAHARTLEILSKVEEKCHKNNIRLLSRPLTPTFKHCSYPYQTPYIAINGDVYACCFMKTLREETSECFFGHCVNVPVDQYKMGNIFENNFEQVWFGESYKLLRKIVKKTERSVGLTISPDELKRERVLNLSKRFSYCQVCLFRWGCAC